MNYLLDKQIKRKRFFSVLGSALILLVLLYFRGGIFAGLSYASQVVFHPVFVLGEKLSGKLKSAGSYFASKASLYSENENLKSKLAEDEARMANYGSLLAENEDLKGVLGRKNEKLSFTLATILAKPNQSPYDTLVVDAGTAQGIGKGSLVFALGDVPIGRVDTVFPSSSKIVLFSSAGERTQVVVSDKPDSTNMSSSGNVFLEAVGRGGGNFEMVLPRGFAPTTGEQVILPGLTPYVLATVATTISDPRDPFVKALMISPVNIQELKFVEIEQ